MKKITRYSDWSIKFKLLVMSILLTFCSILLISFISYKQYIRDFQKQSTDRIQQTIEQVSLNLDTYLDDLLRLSISPYYKRDVMAAVQSDNTGSGSEQLDKSRLIEDFLNEIMITPRNDILRVFIITFTGNVYIGSRTTANIETDIDFHKFNWYNQALKTRDPIFVPVHMEQIIKNPKKMVFSIVSQLRSLQDTNSVIGVIKVDANYSGIKSICDKVNMGKMGKLFIVDENKNIIYPESMAVSGLDKDSSNLISQIGTKSKTPETISQGKESYLINTAGVARSNWTIIAVNSLSELNEQAAKTRNMSFLLAVIFSLFSVLIFAVFYRQFLNPVMAIVKLMKEVKNGNLTVRYKGKSNDELGYLGASFNMMVSRIDEMLDENTALVKQVYEFRLLQKEAQFNALYSQIKPHFMYNTLNMISLSMQCGKYKNAVDNINRLGKLLRGLTNMNREISLEMEISLLDSYLNIQSSRYEGKLEFIIKIDAALYKYNIPALLLQPIVENSIVHGCEPKKEKTTIEIFNEYDANSVIIYVKDDGIGIPEDKLSAIRLKIDGTETDNTQSGTFECVGLANVNKRIKLKFGEMYGLQLFSRLGEGTVVRITLPNIPHMEGEYHVQTTDN